MSFRPIRKAHRNISSQIGSKYKGVLAHKYASRQDSIKRIRGATTRILNPDTTRRFVDWLRTRPLLPKKSVSARSEQKAVTASEMVCTFQRTESQFPRCPASVPTGLCRPLASSPVHESLVMFNKMMLFNFTLKQLFGIYFITFCMYLVKNKNTVHRSRTRCDCHVYSFVEQCGTVSTHKHALLVSSIPLLFCETDWREGGGGKKRVNCAKSRCTLWCGDIWRTSRT